ncbi:GvpL/GvpF family gas vesicle protein [Streptomyces sp. NPDC021212]|uniref:GvpL/GvpF family gas vesicle protein n=1 Tax=Streptomyces sp. NPDC021212 TaxID=3365118 RepID=UPI00378FB95F
MTEEALATWLYAVTAAREESAAPAGLTGVADEPVRLVGNAGLAAVVGSVPLDDFGEEPLRAHLEDLPWLERAARAHHRVIGRAAGYGQVIPLRFATIYHDDGRVRTMLQERRDDFTATLARVAGRTEWGVKAYVDPRAFLPDPGDEVASGGDSPGTDYLLRRRAQRDDKETAHLRATERAEEIHTALAALAAATATHPPQDARLAAYEGWMVLNNSYLVPDDRTEEFTAAVTGLGERYPDVDLELSGPWPPYSFTAPPEREEAS